MIIISDLFSTIKIIIYYQLFVFLAAAFFMPLKRKTNKIFFGILICYSLTEFITILMKFVITDNHFRTNMNYNNYELSFIVTFLLWFFLLEQNGVSKKLMRFVYLFFLCFVVVDFFVIQKDDDLKTYIFCMGSFLYLTIFFMLSFKKLKNEDFNFLFNNEYRLLSAPILMFFGLSLVFAFIEVKLQQVIIYKSYDLYTITTNYINFISYSLLLWYIYIEYRNHKRVIPEE